MKKHTIDYVKIYSENGTNGFSMMASPGDTRSSVSYAGTGTLDLNATSGYWVNIANNVLAFLVGLVTSVGGILYGVAQIFSSVVADTNAFAQAKNMYSYRYVTYQGEVFIDHVFTPDSWEVLAYSHSREIYEHTWGSFVDTVGLTHQSAVDLISYPKATQWAPYASYSAIEARALVVAGYVQRIPEHYYGY